VFSTCFLKYFMDICLLPQRMKLLISKARIICNTSPYHLQVMDIAIENGIITKIAPHIETGNYTLVEADHLHVSIGWMDLFADFADPGYEYRETLFSGIAAAAAGGFTDVVLIPNTQPAVSSKAQVAYLKQKSLGAAVNIHPMGAATRNTDGKELAEMYDMHAGGAVVFGDGIRPIQHPGVMLKALQYVLATDSCLIQLPDDQQLALNGLMNEGVVSTRLGLPGKPTLAEELMVARDLELLAYTGSTLHITGISTQKSIDLIQAARAKGLQITCSATPYHAYFCDEDLVGYDCNLKVNPPLRDRNNMMAIRNAIADGTIDAIASHHMPLHPDEKECEFEYAKYGMTGLETVFPIINQFSHSLERLILQMTIAPRKIAGIAIPEIKENEKACLTFFNPLAEWTIDRSSIRSISHNNPFIGLPAKGRVIGIVNQNQFLSNT